MNAYRLSRLRSSLLTMIVVSLLLFSASPFSESSMVDQSLNQEPLFINSESLPLNLTWSSLDQQQSTIITNGTSCIGDHVVLNATFTNTSGIVSSEMHIFTEEASNYTANVTISNEGSFVIYDTYNLGHNMTVSVNVTGMTAENVSLSHFYRDIQLANFFAPRMLTVDVTKDDEIWNVNWTFEDLNSLESHIFDVLLSFDDGASFMLLEENISQTLYIWNSTGWLIRNYIFEIWVFDNTGLNDSMWSVNFEHSHGPPQSYVSISNRDDIQYVLGSQG
ncbi:MAG: hypothetical protein RTU30_05815, partial [Candidatus Thorarchaeota archaeon]